MTNMNIPPQAYTREDVAKAYVWVQSQPDHVKNLATSKEALVALYLQARRGSGSTLGNYAVENMTSVSTRNFKSQLQSLATELNQFEKNKSEEVMQPTKNTTSFPAPPDFQEFNSEPQMQTQSPQYEERSIEFKLSERHVPQGVSLDKKSQQIINNVKSELNLESDTEVLRMLITLGYDKIKAVFPQK